MRDGCAGGGASHEFFWWLSPDVQEVYKRLDTLYETVVLLGQHLHYSWKDVMEMAPYFREQVETRLLKILKESQPKKK